MDTKYPEIDQLDRQILSILMEDAKTPYTKIGEMLFVSAGTVHVRMKKMDDLGIIKRHQLVVNHEKLGYDITAFLGVYLRQSSMYKDASKQLREIPEVIEQHFTTGEYSMFVKIICRDTTHLKEVIHDKIQNIPSIQRTETFISLEEGVNRSIKLLEDEVDTEAK